MSELFILMWEFFKTGLFAVGGGLATLPFLQDMSQRFDWFSAADLVDMVAISESTPGPIGINMATFVGYRVAGVPGAILTSLSLVAPSLILILIIAKMLNKFKENQLVQDTFYGLRPASIGLITAASVEIVKVSLLKIDNWTGFSMQSILNVIDWPCIILAAVLLVVTNLPKIKNLHPVFFLAGSAGIGIVMGLLGFI